MWDEYEDYEDPDDEDRLMGREETKIHRQSRKIMNEAETALRRRPHLEDADWWVK